MQYWKTIHLLSHLSSAFCSMLEVVKVIVTVDSEHFHMPQFTHLPNWCNKYEKALHGGGRVRSELEDNRENSADTCFRAKAIEYLQSLETEE